MFGWAFLGCGNIAEQVANEIAGEAGQKIVSCWNRSPERAQKFAVKYGARAYRTAEEALKAEGVNAAYIAVTADKHLDYIRLCLNAGVPVLCEKPFTVNAGEAEQAFALAKEKGLYLCEAMWTWFNAPALTVRTWLPKIGAVKKVTAKYCVPISGNPRLVDPVRLGGALVDIGVYPIRYAYELFGMPKKIVCEGSVEGGVDHKEKVTLFYDGFEAVLEIDMDEFKGEEFVIEGEKGCIRVPWFHAAQEVLLTGEEEARFEDGSPKYAVQLRRAAEEIANGCKESAFCPPSHTVDVMRILDECRRQMGLVYPSER